MATDGPVTKYRPDVLDEVTRMLDGDPRVKRTQMFGYPSFSTGGKMFACLYEEGLAVKLPPATVAALEGRPDVDPFVPGGRVRMGGWVWIRRATAAAYAQDRALLDEAITFVGQAAIEAAPSQKRRRPAPRTKPV